MKLYNNFDIKNIHKKSIILIGNFDGLHLGHQKLFSIAKKYKKKYSLNIGVLTFEPMPKMYFNKNVINFRISNQKQRFNILNKLSVDFVISKKFDKEFSKIKSIDFIKDIINNKLNAKFNFTIYNPWINLYKFGQHQEVHDHCGSDLSSVFFMNDGDEFFFYDRNSTNLTNPIKKFIGYKNVYGIEAKAGDIMFFPSHMLHGVSPIKNDATRITMSVNFDINK